MSLFAEQRLTVALSGTDGALTERLAALLEAEGAAVARATKRDALAASGASVAVIAEDMGTVRTAEVLRRLRRDSEALRIVLVRTEIDGHAVRRALEAGAHGIVALADAARVLGPTVRAVAAGQVVVPDIARHAMAPPALSHRERQILALVVEGCTNGEIGQRLFLAESTVKSHLATAFAKLGVKSRRDATAVILSGDPALRTAVLGRGGSSRRGRVARAA